MEKSPIFPDLPFDGSPGCPYPKAFWRGGGCAAICAAPSVLAKAGVLAGRNATIFSGMENELKNARFIDKPVVEDGNFITSQGPGTAMEFALVLLKRLTDEKKAGEVKKKLLYRPIP